MIHMEYQALFSSKDKSKKLERGLLHFLFGALRVKHYANRKDKNSVLIISFVRAFSRRTRFGDIYRREMSNRLANADYHGNT